MWKSATHIGSTRWLLVATIAVGIGFRVWGIDWQLPFIVHNDEDFYAGRAIRMVRSGELNPGFFQNPQLLTYWLAAQYWVMLGVANVLGAASGPRNLLEAFPFTTLFVIARLNSALFGVLTLLALYRLATACYGRTAGVLAAMFLSVNLLHVRDSHFATNDVSATLFLVLATIAGWEVSRRPTLRNYLLIGVLGGLATGVKYSMGLFFVTALVAHALAWGRHLYFPIAVSRLLIAGLVSVAVFLATNPYSLLDYAEFRHDFEHQVATGAVYGYNLHQPATRVLYLLTLVQSAGIVQVLLAGLGLGVLLLRDRRTAALIGAFPAAYLAFMGQQELVLVRYSVPLVPFLCLFAAIGVLAIARALSGRQRLATAATLVLVLAALAHPSALAIEYNLVMLRDDTRVLAARWMSEHLAGRGKVIADHRAAGLTNFGASPMPGVDLRRVERTFTLDDEFDVRDIRFIAMSDHQRSRYRETAEYFEGRTLNEGQRKGVGEARRATEFTETHVPIATFDSSTDPDPTHLTVDDYLAPFWSVGSRDRPGPTIRIYALD